MTRPPQRYFGGRSVHDGRVHLLSATTFRALVESQVFIPVSFPMTRHDFLMHPDRDRLKDGPLLVASTYAEDDARRANDNATGFTLIIIDLDGAEARDFYESPTTIREALAPHNFAAWTTAKHTTENPRLKIMVECITSGTDIFKRTARHVTRMLGLPETFKGSPESKTLSLPQYRPLHFQGEEYSAVIASRLDGTPFDPATVPDEDLAPEEGFAYTGEGIGDITTLPCPGVTLDDVREALASIDPDCDYRTWYEIAAALRHHFTDEDEAREAFEAYDSWSSSGSKYKGRDETMLKWRSFKPYPEGRNPITLRSLFHHAVTAGWKPEKFTKRLAEDFAAWCGGATQDDLMGEGVRRIAGTPVRSEMADELMADTVVANIKRLGGKISRAAVIKDVRTLRRHDRLETAKAENPAWMMPFCFIGPMDRFRNNINGSEYSVDAFNHTFSRHMIPEDEPPADGKAVLTPANYALNVAQIPVVDGTLYDPRQESGQKPYFDMNGRTYVNTFLSSSVPTPSPIGAKRAGNLIRKLLSANLNNEGYERIVLDFLAYCIQHPGEKIRWTIFLQGGQGCGKGTLIDTVEASLGRANLKRINGGILNGNFDDWREGASFVYVDELFSAGANRHEVNNKLKDAISNTFIPVNRKFRDVVNIPNVSNYFATTNKHDALVLEDSDRRYMVLKSSLQTKDRIAAFTDEGIMLRIHELIDENPGAFRHFFLNHRISEGFNPNGHAPDTVFRHELVEQGKNAVQIMIEDMIEDTDHPLVGADVVHYRYLERATEVLTRNSARPSHYLHSLGYRAYKQGKKQIVAGERTPVFVHCERFVEGLEDPVEVLEIRGEKEL